jgi:iron-sulfur cluster assembly protein
VVGSGDITVEIPDGRTVPIAMVPPASALPVSLSKRAARHVASQLARLSGAPGVRLSVEPAGCSGLRYRLTPVDAFRNDDTVFESCGIRIAIDPASLPHVHGTAVDIVQDGLARRVRFHNPNAKQSCGCGESFAT